HARTDKDKHWPRRSTRAQIGDNATYILLGAAVDEHALGVAGGKYAATVGGARLVQNRCALRRWLPQWEGVDMELSAVMVHQPHPSRIGVDAPSAITLYRVVRPTALPQRVDHLQVFVRQVIPVVMLHLRIETHRARGAVQVAGDDVPPDAATREMIQCRHATGEQKRRFVRKVTGH